MREVPARAVADATPRGRVDGGALANHIFPMRIVHVRDLSATVGGDPDSSRLKMLARVTCS